MRAFDNFYFNMVWLKYVEPFLATNFFKFNFHYVLKVKHILFIK